MQLRPPGCRPLHLQRVPLPGDIRSDLYVLRLHPYVQHSRHMMHLLHVSRQELPMQRPVRLRAQGTSCARRSPGGSSQSTSATTRTPSRPLSTTMTAFHPTRQQRFNSQRRRGEEVPLTTRAQGRQGGRQNWRRGGPPTIVEMCEDVQRRVASPISLQQRPLYSDPTYECPQGFWVNVPPNFISIRV